MLLIAGGQLDPNLQALGDAALALGVGVLDVRQPPGSSSPFHWDLTQALAEAPASLPWAPAMPRVPSGPADWPTGAFVRQDVFASLEDPRPAVAQRALGWFTAVQGWLMAHPQVRTFNADMSAVALNKPAALLRAAANGLRIPRTWLSNDTERLRARLPEPSIAKPVAGGGLCHTLEDALHQAGANHAHSAMPALVQPRLVAPELRVFVVGLQTFAFEVRSPSLDYRAEQDAQVLPVPVPPEAAPLRALMADLRMDFGAADFKTDPHTGSLVFLELNTSPMFARFDLVSGGALAQAMVRHLVALERPDLSTAQAG